LSHDWHWVALAACGRGDLLLDEPAGTEAATETTSVSAQISGAISCNTSATVCGFIVSKTMSRLDRFAIVGGYRNAELLRDRGCLSPHALQSR